MLTKTVEYTFLSVNRRNDEVRGPHCNVHGPGLRYSVDLLVANVYGTGSVIMRKTRRKISAVMRTFSQCTAASTDLSRPAGDDPRTARRAAAIVVLALVDDDAADERSAVAVGVQSHHAVRPTARAPTVAG